MVSLKGCKDDEESHQALQAVPLLRVLLPQLVESALKTSRADWLGFPRFAHGAGPRDPGPPANSVRLKGVAVMQGPRGTIHPEGLVPAFCSVGIPPHHWFIMSSEIRKRRHEAFDLRHVGSLQRFRVWVPCESPRSPG